MTFRVIAVLTLATSALLLGYAVEAIRMHSHPPFTYDDRSR